MTTMYRFESHECSLPDAVGSLGVGTAGTIVGDTVLHNLVHICKELVTRLVAVALAVLSVGVWELE